MRKKRRILSLILALVIILVSGFSGHASFAGEVLPDSLDAKETVSAPDTSEMEEPVSLKTVFTYEDHEKTVTVTLTEQGALPEQAVLKVHELSAANEEQDALILIKHNLEEKARAEQKQATALVSYAITFELDGKTIESSGPAEISIVYKGYGKDVPYEGGYDAQNDSISVLHFNDLSGTKKLEDVYADVTMDDQGRLLSAKFHSYQHTGNDYVLCLWEDASDAGYNPEMQTDVIPVTEEPESVPEVTYDTSVAEEPESVPEETYVTPVTEEPESVPEETYVTPVTEEPESATEETYVTSVTEEPESATEETYVTPVTEEPESATEETYVTPVVEEPESVPEETYATPVAEEPESVPEETYVTPVAEEPENVTDETDNIQTPNEPESVSEQADDFTDISEQEAGTQEVEPSDTETSGGTYYYMDSGVQELPEIETPADTKEEPEADVSGEAAGTESGIYYLVDPAEKNDSENELTTDEESVSEEETSAEEETSEEETSAEEVTSEEESSEEETIEEETTEEETTTAEKETEPPTEAPRTRRVYTYEDDFVKVRAVLQKADAVPDDAELVVTPIRQETEEYNYDAYMEALNSASEDGKEYTGENTLLYDIAFMVPVKERVEPETEAPQTETAGDDEIMDQSETRETEDDAARPEEEGPAVQQEEDPAVQPQEEVTEVQPEAEAAAAPRETGDLAALPETEEYIITGYREFEPEAGSVTVSIVFKNKQLSEEIQAEDTGTVEVTHLTASTDLNPAQIQSEDITPETVDASVNLGPREDVVFTTDSFSVYAITYNQLRTYVISADGDTYEITATYDENSGISKDAELVVQEITEGNSDYNAYLEKTDLLLPEDETVAFARYFDIHIMQDGIELQPLTPVEIRIELADTLSDDVKAVHFVENNEGQEEASAINESNMALPDQDHAADALTAAEGSQAVLLDASLTQAEVLDSAVSFAADGFSVYGVVLTEKITTRYLSTDGETYEITVSYGLDAEVPKGSRLNVSEITKDNEEYEYYLRETAGTLGTDEETFSYTKLLDIGIVDIDGNTVEPAEGAFVDVSIRLLDLSTETEDSEELSVVHFSSGTNQPEQMVAMTEDNQLFFSTDSFSAYAIVKGPSLIPLTWTQLTTMAQFQEYAATGIYIGTTSGYYLKNEAAAGSKDATTTGILKTTPANSYPMTESVDAPVLYYFEPAQGNNQYYIWCYDNQNQKQYVHNSGDKNLTFTDEKGRTAFEVLSDSNNKRFRIHNGRRYWNMWNGAGGNHIAAYDNAGDGNNYFYFWHYEETDRDVWGMDGKTYGLMNWAGGTTGRAMMADSSIANVLNALPLTVMAKTGKNEDKLFVPDDSDISLWTFHWIEGTQNEYYVTTEADGVTKYLNVTSAGLSLADTPVPTCELQMTPGNGTHEGEICLKSSEATLTYSGKVADGFKVKGSAGMEWLKLVEMSELTSDYFLTYSAQKVGVSDEAVTNGSRIIVYTRVWNETQKKYEFYAIDHDGSLVRCYETGDSIEWVGSRLNTLLWNFVEYYWEGTSDPNYYYELYNQYSEKYIAPQAAEGQILSDHTIGINLNGRQNGQYYSTIMAWDDDYYAYSGLKADVNTGKVISCSRFDAEDFYFAVMQDLPVDDELITVPTLDSTAYGITMKLTNFKTRNEMSNFLGSDAGGAVNNTDPDLLSTDLKDNGYPATKAGNNLSSWFAGAPEVNHLFISSTYNASGYFEYDATQNFASLHGNDFVVYKEIATVNNSGVHYQHGQFFPYNDLKAGMFASTSPKNLTTSGGNALPNTDPRKYEQLYLVQNPDYYMGMEITASFTQTPDGLDDWGHDIIYEFTGDDDFWLYVDGELIIDLGGIHNALSGSVNFRTGDVMVNGTHTTLKDLFYNNYTRRGHTSGEAQARIDALFRVNEAGQYIFKDYTNHTMKIFYLERGAGASNLHMRFNLSSVKQGTVRLRKELEGVDASEEVLAEFPYQIIYRTRSEGGEYVEHYLTNSLPDTPTQMDDYVFYKDSANPVKYEPATTISGVSYEHVFFLKPDEEAEINFPEGMVDYKIIECGVNTEVYNKVKVNGQELEGVDVVQGETAVENRKDYGIDYAATDIRARVNYVNTVNPDALRRLSLTKKLYREDGLTPIGSDAAAFSFRLYMATEYDPDLDTAVAGMHTYHVKNPSGYYCRWDVQSQSFVVIEGNISDYAQLTAEQKEEASFTTSINGSISKIPVGYTVEVRNVLAGTKFKIVERPAEIPDGYSFQKYEYNRSDYDGNTTDALTGVSDTVITNLDPLVTICNLKGWGLRVNKIWTDKDYMSQRDSTYFAVFTDDGTGSLTLADHTLREMPYGQTSLYWYFLPLPRPEIPFDQYEIREVKLENPVVDAGGYVTSFDSLEILEAGDPITLHGLQKGEADPGIFTYTVQYEKGIMTTDSNVRVDTVTNNRPGIVLKKTEWDGTTAMQGAEFTLNDPAGNLIGTFTSDETGQITVAFLSDEKEYTLTETKTPHTFSGLEAPAVITLNNGNVTVTGIGEEYYIVSQEEDKTPTLTIKNRPFTLQAVKQETGTQIPLEGVVFALHKQHIVDGVVSFDTEPMPGYEALTTDAGGVIPKIDNTLEPGTYEIREKTPLGGYEALSSHIDFTISQTGQITMSKAPEGTALTSTLDDSTGTKAYTITINNTQKKKLTIKKVDKNNPEKTLAGAIFDLYPVTDGERAEAPLYQNLTSAADGILVYQPGTEQAQTVFELSTGVYHLVETQAPAGYNVKSKEVVITVSGSGVLWEDEDDPSAGENSQNEAITSSGETPVYLITITNERGYALPATGGSGTGWLYAVGGLLVALAGVGLLLKKRRDRKNR